jgi:hypothetical protein
MNYKPIHPLVWAGCALLIALSILLAGFMISHPNQPTCTKYFQTTGYDQKIGHWVTTNHPYKTKDCR